MQIPKENIKRRILNVARQEFCRKGFRRTSIKDIASASGIAVGNIYNYFRSKNEIFVEVCTPLTKELGWLLPDIDVSRSKSLEMFSMKCFQETFTNQFICMIKSFRKEFRLLLFEAAGTPLENFFKEFSVRQAAKGMAFMQVLKKKHPEINIDISKYFIQANCEMWQFLLRKIIQNDDMTDDQMLKFVTEYVTFELAGWKKLLKIEPEKECNATAIMAI